MYKDDYSGLLNVDVNNRNKGHPMPLPQEKNNNNNLARKTDCFREQVTYHHGTTMDNHRKRMLCHCVRVQET